MGSCLHVCLEEPGHSATFAVPCGGMAQVKPMTIEWIDPEVQEGPVFRIGSDVAIRDGANCLRMCTQTTPDHAYRLGLESALGDLAERWGGSLELVLDFEGRGPPQPGQALQMCRSLTSLGHIHRITLIQKEWMPSSLVSAVLALIRASGTPVFLREKP